MKNFIFLLLTALGFFLAIFFFWKFDRAQNELNLANRRMTDRDTKIYQQDKQISELKKQLQQTSEPKEDTIEMEMPAAARFTDELGILSESDKAKLKKKGLRSPEVDLMNDLIRNQKSLLAAKGTMGGTLAIQDTRILNDRYALSYFEDGHNGGFLLLKFDVVGGNITWRVLDQTAL